MQPTRVEQILALLAGIGVLWWMSSSSYWQAGFGMWPGVDGRVISSSIDHKVLFYKPIITYKYAVNGKIYRGDSLTGSVFGHLEMWPDGAQRIVQKYQPGQSVDVHFDPADPDRSSLGISFGRGTIESYCELLMFLFAVALFFFAFPKMLSGSHGGGGGRSGLGVVSRDLEDQIRKYSKYE